MKNITTVLLALVLFVSGQGAFAERGPSTAEDRARVVQLVQKLQANPIDPRLTSDREWALQWLIEVPDVNVTICPDLLAPVLGTQYRYRSDLIVFNTLASAVFVIQNPGANLFRVNQAALERTLAAYQSILKARPTATLQGLDDLVEMKNNGGLDKYVQSATENCTRGAQRASFGPKLPKSKKPASRALR
jgi:hypothetical protein